MAGVIKRANKWVAVIRTNDGKELRKSTGVDVVPKVVMAGQNKKSLIAQNEAKARLVAEEMERHYRGLGADVDALQAMTRGVMPKALREEMVGVSVGEYLREWMKREKSEKASGAIRGFLKFLGDRESYALRHLSPAICSEFVESERERVRASTVSRNLICINKAFNAAVERELIKKNPFKGLRPGKKEIEQERIERKAFTVDEVKLMMKKFPEEWADMIRVCLYTGGARLGDVAVLKWDDIDFEKECLVTYAKKTKLRKTKPLIMPLRKVFERRLATRVNSYVFPVAVSMYAQGGDKSSKLSLAFVELLVEHGILDKKEKVKLQGDRRNMAEKSFHSLRSTAVTILRLSGVSADLCRYIVGHDSEEIERVYFRPDNEAVGGAMKNISDLLE